MISVNNVSKKFEDFYALNNVSCNIPKGAVYGMVGSNGAGKSTFLRLISGVYKADMGDILVDEEPIYNNPLAKGKMVFLSDDLYFLPGASLKRMSEFYKSVYPKYDDKRFLELVELFKLNPKKPIQSFSKGMKRQAAIILALSSRPGYMLFDETFDGLDPVVRNLVKKLICEDVYENKTTAILTSHSLRELEDTCDQLALLHKGGLIFESDIQGLKTSLFKVQVAFSGDYDKSKFDGMEMDIRNFSKKGSVSNLIIRGDKEVIASRINSLKPLILDILPLTLEEVFTYEMEVYGYSFNEVLEGIENEK
ncbi:MAG: ABC transporter ATP-binding protein [Lachnospiraceae bacterium]|nr:ABC transporter ATP-binding protein [Lachnospiraceae bacterium]